MAFIPNIDRSIVVGDIVKLLTPIIIYRGTFEAGTIAKVIDITCDGFRIDDGNGNTASGVKRGDIVVIKKLEDIEASKDNDNADDWIYETGKEIPEILGSGSDYYNVEHTKDKELAFQKYKNTSNNYLIRYKHGENQTRDRQQYWDKSEQKWME